MLYAQFTRANRRSIKYFFTAIFILLFSTFALHAQTGTATLTGSIVDVQQNPIPNASLTVKNDATGTSLAAHADARGDYNVTGLAAGKYTVTAVAQGFDQTVLSVVLSAGRTTKDILNLNVSGVNETVTVNATADSLAAKEAPSGGFLEERTPQSIISQTYIQNDVSPVADYGELVNVVPGAYTVNANGVGLGQSKTYFRGFPDGDYNIDFDGIPFYDTNTPTHHSWAFLPQPEVGSVDFERGPGTAATIGPAPFGGSIHLFSHVIPASPANIRFNYVRSSWNTNLYDLAYDSGVFGPDHANNLYIDVQRMSSDGYETNNYQEHDAGHLKYEHRFGSRYILTGLASVDHLNANTPNFNGPTRAQIAQYGRNFLLFNNSDPGNYADYQYNFYRVPTDFEYVGVKMDPTDNWLIDAKAYTYDYYNGQHYANAPTNTVGCTGVSPCLAEPYCSTFVVKKGVTAIPCGVDKLNSYRKAGENILATYTRKYYTLRTGVWYEWAHTYRYQWPSDPLNNWQDQTLPNFAEEFITDTLQTFGELEIRPTQRLSITGGVKFYYTSLYTTQYSDDGKTIGTLANSPTNVVNTQAPLPYEHNYADWPKWLPSLDANYRLTKFWSVYGQTSQGSIVPPSAVFDVPHAQLVTVNLKQQLATTYQGGTSVKLHKYSLDADYYMTRFQGSYAAANGTNGDTIYVLQPDSTTKGFEGEMSYDAGHGISLYTNGTVGSAIYRGTQHIQFLAPSGTTNPGTGATTTDEVDAYVPVPSGLWVANTPGNTEDAGITYNRRGLLVNLSFKRVGDQWTDNTNTSTLTTVVANSSPTANTTYTTPSDIIYHMQNPIGAIKTANFFINYTPKLPGFENTKVRFGIGNLLNQTSIFNVGNNANNATPIPASGVSLGSSGFTSASPFFATTAISSTDTLQTLPGRSYVVSIQFGINPKMLFKRN